MSTLVRSLLAIGLVAGFTALGDGCGNGDACVPGDSKACTCTSGDSGAQLCKPDGTGYALCQCNSTSGPSTGPGGTTTSSSSSSATGSGGGGGAPCQVGTTMNCYDGPAGTENVGTCHGGIAACLPDGSAWGPCENEIVPATENCGTPDDEDCDNQTPACPGPWSVVLGDTDADNVSIMALAKAPNGDLVIAGELAGSMTVAGVTYTAPVTGDGFVARFTSEGVPLWARLLTGLNIQVNYGVAVQSTGDSVSGGQSADDPNFGSGAVPTNGQNGYYWRVNSAGQPQSGTLVSDAGMSIVWSVAVAPNDDVVIAGYYNGLVSIGGIELPQAPSTVRGFVARLDPTGTTAAWVNTYEGTWYTNVAVAPNGDVLFADTLNPPQTVDLGFGSVDQVSTYVLRLSPTGAPLAQTVVSQMGGSTEWNVVTPLSDNGFLFGGMSQGAIDLGSGPLDPGGSFFGRFDVDGNVVHGYGFGAGGGASSVSALTGFAGGGGAVAGWTPSGLTIDGTTYTAAGAADAFFMRLDADGTPSSVVLLGAPGASAYPRGLVAEPSGAIVAAGVYFGSGIDLGDGNPLPVSNGPRGFLARLDL